MPNKKGGYQIVDVLALTYALALEYLNCGKPLLVVDGTNHPFFADSVTLNADDEVVIQKGGYTITIDDEDNITTDGSIPVSGGGDSGLKLYVHSFTITTDQYPFTSLKVILGPKFLKSAAKIGVKFLHPPLNKAHETNPLQSRPNG